MMRRLLLTLGLSMLFAGCAAKYQKPSHLAEVDLSINRSQEVINTFDRDLESFGLKRFAAAPGLNELQGRDVIFGVYKTDAKSQKAALEITNIKVANRLEVFIYTDYFDGMAENERFLASVSETLTKYGAKISIKGQ